MATKEIEKIKVFALGGAGEIGKNMYVLETNNQIFIVEAGLMVPGDEMFGIDAVIPDISYLIENQNKIVGIFLTHGHPEQIGGLPYILKKLTAPVYGTKFTLGLVKEELKGNQIVEFHEVDQHQSIQFEEISVSFFRTTHNIPDSIGIIFDTPQGAIVYTGDYKFDQTSIGLYGADLEKMAQIGRKGVLCLLSDSMNAEKPGYSGSESQVASFLSEAFYQQTGRIIIVSYATNIQRLQNIVQAAKESKRKVVFVGKKLNESLEIAKELDYIHLPEETLVAWNDRSKLADHEVVMVASGYQGDPVSALSKLAKGTHKQIQIKQGDTVIVATASTPATEITIAKSIDLLYRAGVNVVYDKKIDVAGHGYQEEIKLMLNLMNPKYLIPIHGEFRMQRAHAKVAESLGMKTDQIFLVDKGEAIEFVNQEATYGNKVNTGNVLIDGLGVGDVGNIVLRDRRLLSQDGILVVVVTLSKDRNHLKAGPEIISRGFVYVRESEKLLVDASDIVKGIIHKCIEDKDMDWSSIKVSIRDSLNQFLYEKTKRRPMILPIIMEA
ncbi:ribonuclease J [Bacillus mesophilus]|uniref:Ribonuclease J n=1 Tax=Bacillus mesophilus TaxID=1808955 RepID=A0A6M0Q4R1_9BACI|nr:ribonuclease J [Bacillus mesophilus]MBM7659304.1 ribonuclease J [Bacillus mesophilus]NEY70178.1 ribonuclease J [Bacillus mesophilus]